MSDSIKIPKQKIDYQRVIDFLSFVGSERKRNRRRRQGKNIVVLFQRV